jgi:mRNA interferase RelE/StbE
VPDRERYQVEFSKPALKQFQRLPREVQERIAPRIDALAADPRPHGVEKLEGEDDFYRLRVGSYRVVYTIRDRLLLVLVLRMGHRRDIYKKK